jgi:hypothetical protein
VSEDQWCVSYSWVEEALGAMSGGPDSLPGKMYPVDSHGNVLSPARVQQKLCSQSAASIQAQVPHPADTGRRPPPPPPP